MVVRVGAAELYRRWLEYLLAQDGLVVELEPWEVELLKGGSWWLKAGLGQHRN